MQQKLGYLYIALAAVFWCFFGPLSRLVFNEGVSPLEAAFWRACIAAIFFVIHAIPQKAYRVPPRVVLVFAGFAIIALALFYALLLTAVAEAGAALTSVLLYTAPAWVALLSFFIFHEPLPFIKIAALILAMTGAALACFSGGGLPEGASTLGMGLALLCGFLYSLHYIFAAHFLTSYSAIAIYCWCMPIAALALYPFVTFVDKTPAAWGYLIAIGFVATYAPLMAYCAALKRLPPTTVAVVANLEPIFTSLLAWWWLGEVFSLTGWIGAVLVCAALVLIVLSNPQPPVRTQAQA